MAIVLLVFFSEQHLLWICLKHTRYTLQLYKSEVGCVLVDGLKCLHDC